MPNLTAVQLTARYLFRDHGHDGWRDTLTRENCGACALAGYGAHTDGGRVPLQPNYAGWERRYVQAGETVPAQFRDAFAAAQHDDHNPAYLAGLLSDIATYGVHVQPARKGTVLTVEAITEVSHHGVSVNGNSVWQLVTTGGTFRTRQGSSYLTPSGVKGWVGRSAALYLNGRGTVDRIV